MNKELGADLPPRSTAARCKVKASGGLAGHHGRARRQGGRDRSPAIEPGQVVINERTGTIIAGGDVRLAPVAIAQGGLTIVIKENLRRVAAERSLRQGDDRRGIRTPKSPLPKMSLRLR